MSRVSKAVISYRQRTKRRAIVYKGGACIACGYSRCVRSLQFHHLDPSQKDYGISTGDTRAWHRVRAELDKCVLLCANCHGEVHDDLLDLTPHLHKSPSPGEGRKRVREAGLSIQRQVPGGQRNHCQDCDKRISRNASKCGKCASKGRPTKIEWPPLEDLRRMVEETSYVAAGRVLGVSDNAIRKHLRKHAPRQA